MKKVRSWNAMSSMGVIWTSTSAALLFFIMAGGPQPSEFMALRANFWKPWAWQAARMRKSCAKGVWRSARGTVALGSGQALAGLAVGAAGAAGALAAVQKALIVRSATLVASMAIWAIRLRNMA